MNKKVLNICELGQVFTPDAVVETMLSLRENEGTVLEPACGSGQFLRALEPTAVGIEIDSELTTDTRVVGGDFFQYSLSNKYDTIIGNPPYVRFQDIQTSTRDSLSLKLFDRRSNLYLFFIEKCIQHLNHGGELIFITPRDFIKATAARKLNRVLYAEGSFTHFTDLGDSQIFDGTCPNCAIWRWVKGRRSRQMGAGRNFCFADGQIWFGAKNQASLKQYFSVKVGAVSGADHIFCNPKYGTTDMVCSTTIKDGKPRKVIYNENHQALAPHKHALLKRRIRKFDDSNWWEWGRRFCQRTGPRIYVNAKTRMKKPFFTSETEAYDGSVLALFPNTDIDLNYAVGKLNTMKWDNLGFVCDGRYLFTQKSLENAPIEL